MRLHTVGFVLALTLLAGAAAADDLSPVGVAVKVGTPGLTAEGTFRLIDTLNLRLGVNYLKYDTEGDVEDVHYDFGVRFLSTPLYLDWHPFGGNWRVSIAAVYNDSHVELSARPAENVTLGDHEYTPEQVGTISGHVKLQPWAPYVGLGFGNNAMPDQRWIFVFDLGVVYLSYDVKLSADGLYAQDPQFQEDLRSEEEKLQDTADEWKIYPVLSFGVGFHF